MSIYPDVTQEELNNLRKIAEQHKKEQRALQTKNSFLRQTHDVKLAEPLSPTTEKLDEVNESTKQLGEVDKKSDVQDENTQTPAMENITGTQSLRDTLSFMKKCKNFFKLLEKDKGDVFWNKILIKSLGQNRINNKDNECDIYPNIQAYFTNTKLATKTMNDEDKSTVYDICKNTGFFSIRHKKGLKSVWRGDAL